MSEFSYFDWVKRFRSALVVKMSDQNFVPTGTAMEDEACILFRNKGTGNYIAMGRPGMCQVPYTPGRIEVSFYSADNDGDSPELYDYVVDASDLDAVVKMALTLEEGWASRSGDET